MCNFKGRQDELNNGNVKRVSVQENKIGKFLNGLTDEDTLSLIKAVDLKGHHIEYRYLCEKSGKVFSSQMLTLLGMLNSNIFSDNVIKG